MPTKHPSEVLADEVTAYIERESDRIAASLTNPDYKPPFGNRLTEKEQLERYIRMQPADWVLMANGQPAEQDPGTGQEIKPAQPGLGLEQTLLYKAKMEKLMDQRE